MSGYPRIGIVAASSAVPMVELHRGVEALRREGMEVLVHDQVARQHFSYAGRDEERAGAFFEYAMDPRVEAIWCARGGYGATRLLPLLDAMSAKGGIPPSKLLIGYSDVTALHEYVRRRWNWWTLHAPMPAASSFPDLRAAEWSALLDLLRRQRPTDAQWPGVLRFVRNAPGGSIEGTLVGGNLTLWECMMGTPYAPLGGGNMLFFEDVGEAWYRIDRMVTQLHQAGAFEGISAVVLGDFTDCKDDVLMGLPSEEATEKTPLRRCYSKDEAIEEIFGTLAEKAGFALATGLPVGHGPSFAPLPLGASYRLGTDGRLEMTNWEWTG